MQLIITGRNEHGQEQRIVVEVSEIPNLKEGEDTNIIINGALTKLNTGAVCVVNPSHATGSTWSFGAKSVRKIYPQ